MSVYDILGPEGYEMLYREHLASAADDVREWQREIQRLELPSSGRLLDIGCGLGERTAEWAALGYAVTGIDISHAMLATARLRFPRLDLLECDAFACSQLGSFDLAVAHFNFLMMMPTTDVRAFLNVLHSCVSSGGAFVTDICRPREKPEDFCESWMLNGKTLVEVGTLLEDRYHHEWFESGINERICDERFWLRTREDYREIAESTGWNIRFADWKTDALKVYDLMIFTHGNLSFLPKERNLEIERR